MKFFVIFIVVLTTALPVLAQTGKKVGGSCSYDKYDGVCKIEKGTGEYFTFNGEVNAKKVTLHKNKLGFGEKLEDNAPCSLQFIKTGTCTPCVFSVGECGKEAWDLFRKP